jgi:hypothetical protein
MSMNPMIVQQALLLWLLLLSSYTFSIIYQSRVTPYACAFRISGLILPNQFA